MRAKGLQMPAPSPSSRLWRLLGPTLLASVLILLFVGLGEWQWQKAQAKAVAQARLDTLHHDPPVAVPKTPVADPESLRHRLVVARGRYDVAGQILIDNRVLHEQAGFHVVTPLRLDGDAGMRVLVNRGWVAADARRRPPTVDTPTGEIEVVGTATIPATKIFALAPDTAAAGGSGVWQNLDLARYRAATAAPLQPFVILLDPASPAGGFDRDWPRLDERQERHLSYALQWFGFAAATFAIWLWFAVRLWTGSGGEPA